MMSIANSRLATILGVEIADKSQMLLKRIADGRKIRRLPCGVGWQLILNFWWVSSTILSNGMLLFHVFSAEWWSATTPDSSPFTLCVPPSCTYAGPGAPSKLGTGVEARQLQWCFFLTISCTASSWVYSQGLLHCWQVASHFLLLPCALLSCHICNICVPLTLLLTFWSFSHVTMWTSSHWVMRSYLSYILSQARAGGGDTSSVALS